MVTKGLEGKLSITANKLSRSLKIVASDPALMFTNASQGQFKAMQAVNLQTLVVIKQTATPSNKL